MSSLFNLFDKNTDTYSLKHLTKVPAFTLDAPDPSSHNEEDAPDSPSNEELDCQYLLTCDILYEKCKVACIPVKTCWDDVWPEKKLFKYPFKLLESPALLHRLVHLVEPYIMDYQQTYQRLHSPDVSPFTRDFLKGVYILYHESIDLSKMIRHNNYVLSTLFQNTLPGKPVLWHIVFLYVLATEKFPDYRDRLFQEIRFLGEHTDTFVTLTPYLDPPIVAPLNVCFWYIAHVCHVAFPNSKKNILRNPEYISGVFLDFYRHVYEADYAPPSQLPLWQLWSVLCTQSKEKIIFNVLAHYFEYEDLGPELDSQDTQTFFRLVLYRRPKPADKQPPQPLACLASLDLTTVMNVYGHWKRRKNWNYYENVVDIRKSTWELYNPLDEKMPDLLSHIRIHLETCHPYVMCPITGKYWRDCIGEYDVQKYSYARLFRKYCEKYKKYPATSHHLMVFLNEELYTWKAYIPELFPAAVRQQMEEVMAIFQKVREKYTCLEYITRVNKNASEKIRLRYEGFQKDEITAMNIGHLKCMNERLKVLNLDAIIGTT